MPVFNYLKGINRSPLLPEQQSLPLSGYPYLYDLIIPKENLLRKINDLVDFSFICKGLMDKYCHDNGRTAEGPIRMFKYLLLKTIYGIFDVDVVERSRYDMSFKYFLDMVPEDNVINPSSLCKFRRLRLKDTDLLELLINKTASIAIEKGIIESGTIIVDSTHTASRSNPYKPVETLKLRSRQPRKNLYDADENIKNSLPGKNEGDDLKRGLDYTRNLIEAITKEEVLINIPKIKERLNTLKETVDDIGDHYTISKDADARTGHKTKDSSFFGYKTHIAISDERIITAATVTSGEKGDGPELKGLIGQSRKHGIPVDTVIGDIAYPGKENLKLSKEKEKGFALVSKINPAISQGHRLEEGKFDFNKDAGMFICPAGHTAIRRAKQGKKGQSKNQAYAYFFDVEKCKICSRRKGCYRERAKTKTYNVPVKTEEQQEQLKFQQTEKFKDKARERYKIEAKNAGLEYVFGYGRTLPYGIDSMHMRGAMVIFAANIKRILKLT